MIIATLIGLIILIAVLGLVRSYSLNFIHDQMTSVHLHRCFDGVDVSDRLKEFLTETLVFSTSGTFGIDVEIHPDYNIWRKNCESGSRVLFEPPGKRRDTNYYGRYQIGARKIYPTGVNLSLVNWLPVIWVTRHTRTGYIGGKSLWLFRSQKQVLKLLQDHVYHQHTKILAKNNENTKNTHIYFTRLFVTDNKLSSSTGRTKIRPIGSVVLEEGAWENFTAVIESFGKSQKMYDALGIPYKLGFLLQGIPGTGKTSLLKMVAAYYDMQLFFIDMSTMTAGLFEKAIDNIREGVEDGKPIMIVFEDLDATGADFGREDHSAHSVKLSQLLNFFDGVNTPQPGLLVVTTNHPDRFDPALIRPGRVDHIIDMVGLPPSRAIKILHNMLEAAQMEKSSLDAPYWERFGSAVVVQPAAVQQFAQMEIFGRIAKSEDIH